jgi:hypothetical protein
MCGLVVVRRRSLVFGATSVAIIALIAVWAVVLPYYFPQNTYVTDITWEIKNKVFFSEATSFGIVKNLVPPKLSVSEADTDSLHAYFELGLLHVEIEGKSYDAVSLMLETGSLPLRSIWVPRIFDVSARLYVFGLFTNNSELDEVLSRYGFPHTYVEATYLRVEEGDGNRTTLTMTYPNGTLLADISYTSSGEITLFDQGPWVHFYLRNDNLTVLRWNTGPQSLAISNLGESIGHLNMTTSEGSMIWKALGRTEYITKKNLTIEILSSRQKGVMGWTESRGCPPHALIPRPSDSIF